MAAKTLILSLKRDGRTLSVRELARSGGEIVVGRSHSCALRTPPDDQSVSGRHARVFWKGSKAYIEDLNSRNGVYFDGKRLLKPVRIEKDAVYSLGNCILSVEASAESKNAKIPHRLQFLNGDREGDVVDIVPKNDSKGEFLVGMDPSCDIRLGDMLVSRKHARITVRSDGCYISDLESRNGTFVNDERLGCRERLLRDGDRISIVYVDFRFLQAGISHRRSHLWARIAALCATAAIATAAYFFYMYNPWRPKASDYRALADRAAAEERFDDAARLIDSAMDAPAGEGESLELAMARSQIENWRETHAAWTQATNCLASGKTKTAAGILRGLPEDRACWNWNSTTACEAFSDAVFARDLVRRALDASDALKRIETDSVFAANADSIIERLEAYKKENKSRLASRKYLAGLVKSIDSRIERLRIVSKAIRDIDSGFKGVSEGNPDFAGVLERFSAVAGDTTMPEAARNYARSYVPLCGKFVEAQRFLDREAGQISALEFYSLERGAASFPIPAQEECARNRKFSDARSLLAERHARYVKIAGHLKPMVANMAAAKITEDGVGELVSAVTSPEAWNAILRFDCFKGEFPRDNRVIPTDMYDKMLGIELAYKRLCELPKNPQDSMEIDNIRFVPLCNQALGAFRQVEAFLNAIERPEFAEFRDRGKLGRLRAAGMQTVAAKAALADRLRDLSADKSNPARVRILTGCYAVFFSRDDDSRRYRNLKAIQYDFGELRTWINKLDEAYDNEPSPEKRIEIRDRILDAGIPGMPAVRKRWVEKEYY